MKPMLIDFAHDTGPWRTDLRMPATRAALVVALIAAVALAGAWQRAQTMKEQRLALELELARLVAYQQVRDDRQRLLVRSGGEHAEVLRKAAVQRALPWEAIFRAFESAPAARLESWAPDLTLGIVKVQAQADNIAQVQDYLATLQASPVFARVSLQRHELPAQGTAVNFSYEAVLAAPYRLPDSPGRGAP